MNLSESELAITVKEIAKKIEVGSTYVHYRASDKPYLVLHVGLLEANEEPCVVYQALYGEKLIWVRSAVRFLDTVDFEGKKVTRFRKI